MPDSLNEDRRLRRRLREYFADRTIAEMSIWFWITAVSSLILLVLAMGAALACIAVLGSLRDTIGVLVMLGGIALWLGCLAWLWLNLLRIARGWGPEHLGTPIFKYLQIGFLMTTVLTMFGCGVLIEDFRILLLMLLAFDLVILGMVVVFLLLAWFARCRIPWRTYREILVVIVLFVLQIVLMVRRHRS
jgi:hypothetical protein